MNLKFIVNDYVVIWNLLFQASISENIHKMKQKLWQNHKIEYNQTYRDNLVILKDPKNFIPNNDTIYNLILETHGYEFLKRNTEKFRMELLKVWDERKKETNKIIKNLLRFDIKQYEVLVIPPKLDVVDTTNVKNKKVNTITWGKKIESDTTKTITELVYKIVDSELKDYNKDYNEVVKAVVELAILNEFQTRLSGKSYYLTGDTTLNYLKRQIYPYWLMYMGVEQDDMLGYMTRDKIAFDIEKYTYEKELKGVDLYTFIDFCIKNQKHIVKIEELEII